MEYKDLYALEEDLHTEFKLAKTKVPLDFYETYFAFANTDGGDIYLGIEEEHEKVKGLPGIANWPMYQKAILDTITSKDKCSKSVLDDSSFEAIPLPNGRFVLNRPLCGFLWSLLFLEISIIQHARLPICRT